MENKKIRQGAIVLHIDYQARVVGYEVYINVPKEYPNTKAKIYNNRKYVSEIFTTWEQAMAFKLALQASVLTWKITRMEEKREAKNDQWLQFV